MKRYQRLKTALLRLCMLVLVLVLALASILHACKITTYRYSYEVNDEEILVKYLTDGNYELSEEMKARYYAGDILVKANRLFFSDVDFSSMQSKAYSYEYRVGIGFYNFEGREAKIKVKSIKFVNENTGYIFPVIKEEELIILEPQLSTVSDEERYKYATYYGHSKTRVEKYSIANMGRIYGANMPKKDKSSYYWSAYYVRSLLSYAIDTYDDTRVNTEYFYREDYEAISKKKFASLYEEYFNKNFYEHEDRIRTHIDNTRLTYEEIDKLVPQEDDGARMEIEVEYEEDGEWISKTIIYKMTGKVIESWCHICIVV